MVPKVLYRTAVLTRSHSGSPIEQRSRSRKVASPSSVTTTLPARLRLCRLDHGQSRQQGLQHPGVHQGLKQDKQVVKAFRQLKKDTIALTIMLQHVIPFGELVWPLPDWARGVETSSLT
jgi:hypothetical protein